MEWTPEAQEAITQVPFFVRKRVRKRVEEEVNRWGETKVCLEHVRACQKKFLEGMEDQVKGYRLETCFGAGGCPNRAVASDELREKTEQALEKRQLKTLLRERVKGPLKFHHEVGVSISDCPNACARPQIADMGLIGACKPYVSSELPCTQCGNCVAICQENAISLHDSTPVINGDRCVLCGQCLKVCAADTLQEEVRGYRIMLGGKLGRHPQLGIELPGIYSESETLQVVHGCLDFYQRYGEEGERLGKILEKTGLEVLVREIPVIQQK